MSDITLHIGDVFEQLAKIPDDRNVAMVEDRLGPLVAACDLTVLT